MSVNVGDYINLLKIASTIRSKKLRTAFLQDQYKADPLLYKAIKEVVLNVVNKNVKLTEGEKKKLARYKHDILKLVNDKSLSRRKKHIAQSGGYLHIIIPAVASLLASLING